jgi:bifunctional DNA-binding transcriptional regulator/antitoxin component of YhaV-PrlF toxin-antitoxin module
MTLGLVHITDKNFRITIPEDIRDIEDLKQGDYIIIDITRADLKKPTLDVLSELSVKLDELPDKIANALRRK